jgi:hypothetical protein
MCKAVASWYRLLSLASLQYIDMGASNFFSAAHHGTPGSDPQQL